MTKQEITSMLADFSNFITTNQLHCTQDSQYYLSRFDFISSKYCYPNTDMLQVVFVSETIHNLLNVAEETYYCEVDIFYHDYASQKYTSLRFDDVDKLKNFILTIWDNVDDCLTCPTVFLTQTNFQNMITDLENFLNLNNYNYAVKKTKARTTFGFGDVSSLSNEYIIISFGKLRGETYSTSNLKVPFCEVRIKSPNLYYQNVFQCFDINQVKQLLSTFWDNTNNKVI